MYNKVLTDKNTLLAQELEKCQRRLLVANAELEKYKASPGKVSFYQKFIMIDQYCESGC